MPNEDKIVYLRESDAKPQKKRRRRLRYLNIFLVCAMLFFGYSIVKQEIQLHRIKNETKQMNGQYAALQDEEKLLKAKIEDADSEETIKAQARNTLGWIQQGDIKLVDKNAQEE